jgi:amino acid adenylation domain-containing protein
MNVIDRFELMVQSHPDSPALLLESGQSFTYWQVDTIASSIADIILPAMNAHMKQKVVDETPLVCIMMNRNMLLIASMLAVLKCGAAYVPVDPAFPPDRQSHILNHSKCFLLITDEECYRTACDLGVNIPPSIIVSSLSGQVVHTTVIDYDTSRTLSEARTLSVSRPEGGLMYVLYTSGSTGKPKGVMVKQHGVLNIINWFTKELKVTNESRILGLTTTCFDISVLEIYMPLISGSTLILAHSSTQKNPFHLLDILKIHRVTVFQATPTTYEMMLATGWKGDMTIDFLVGGEAFRPSLFPLVGACRSIRNVYGPTETTIWSSSYTFPSQITDISSLYNNQSVISVPIGLPISHTVFYLVSTTSVSPRFTLSIDDEGELWIGGIGVAAGYLNAPELTVDRFIQNPFGKGLVYRTGDFVKRASDGNYFFVRRLDDQVKIDGFRIELAEIENVYASHSLIDQAVAIVRDNKLIVYLKPKQSSGGDLSDVEKESIREAASRSLTYYMMPK